MATQMQKLQARILELEAVTKKHEHIINVLMSDDFIEKIKSSIDTAFKSFDIIELSPPGTEIIEKLKQHIDQQERR